MNEKDDGETPEVDERIYARRVAWRTMPRRRRALRAPRTSWLAFAMEEFVKDSRLHKPPAHALVSVGRFLLSRGSYRRYVEPHVIDMRHQHFDALKRGDLRKARWVIVRGYWQALKPLRAALWASIVAWSKLSSS